MYGQVKEQTQKGEWNEKPVKYLRSEDEGVLRQRWFVVRKPRQLEVVRNIIVTLSAHLIYIFGIHGTFDRVGTSNIMESMTIGAHSFNSLIHMAGLLVEAY